MCFVLVLLFQILILVCNIIHVAIKLDVKETKKPRYMHAFGDRLSM